MALLQGVLDAIGPDLDDACAALEVVGQDAALTAGQRRGRHTSGAYRDGQQGHGDPLAGGQQHVHLARIRLLGHLVGQLHQLIGALAHGRDHDHHAPTTCPIGDHVLGDGADSRHVSDRRAAELLDHDRPGGHCVGVLRHLGPLAPRPCP